MAFFYPVFSSYLLVINQILMCSKLLVLLFFSSVQSYWEKKNSKAMPTPHVPASHRKIVLNRLMEAIDKIPIKFKCQN